MAERLRGGRLPALVLAAALAATPAAALEVPFLAGRVNDLADLIPPESEARIESTLAALEEDLGAQVAVLTIPGLEGESLEDFSLRVAETWKLGREEFDDGVLLLVARDDRKMRLEVGYGLEETLTDALAGRVLDGVMRPRFRAGDFAGGFESAVTAIDGILRGAADPLPEPTSRNEVRDQPLPARLAFLFFFLLVLGPFSMMAIASDGCSGWFLYLFLIPFWGAFPVALLGPWGLWLAAGWIVGAPVFKLWLSKSAAGRALREHDRWGRWFSTGKGAVWSSRGGGWSSGGGGFSGGGGSFGGGGASSSW